MGNFSACLFDLDGVIVETDKYHFLAWNALAKELKIPFTEHDNELLKGVSRMESLEIVLNLGKISLNEEEKNRLAEKKNDLYKSYLKELTTGSILPGVIDTINNLKSNQIKVGIGSSSKNANFILNQIGLIDAFDTIVDGSMVNNSKPHPDIFLLGAKNLGIKPQDCLVIEDAASGVTAAKNADMKCIGIGLYANLSEADMVIEDLTKLSTGDIKSLFNKNPKKKLA